LKNVTLYRIRYQKLFFHGNTRDKKQTHPSPSPHPLPPKTRQAPPLKLPISQRQDTKFPSLLQNTYGVLLQQQLQDTREELGCDRFYNAQGKLHQARSDIKSKGDD